MTTVKDERYGTVRLFWDAGRIKTFGDIFVKIPKTVVGHDLGMKSDQMTTFINNPVDFKLVKLLQLARLIGVDYLPLVELAAKQSLVYWQSRPGGDEEQNLLYERRRGRKRKVMSLCNEPTSR